MSVPWSEQTSRLVKWTEKANRQANVPFGAVVVAVVAADAVFL